jgi:hypothetical protein
MTWRKTVTSATLKSDRRYRRSPQMWPDYYSWPATDVNSLCRPMCAGSQDGRGAKPDLRSA